MSRGEADLVASIRHELAAIRPARTCCIQAQLAALADSGRRVDVSLARAVHELGTELAQRGAERGWAGSPRSQAERCAADLAGARSAQHCRLALLRGRLLARGSLSLASGSVHLEINVSFSDFCRKIFVVNWNSSCLIIVNLRTAEVNFDNFYLI